MARDPERGRHPTYWLDDGSIVFAVEDTLFKIHRTLLERQSSTFFSFLIPLRVDKAGANGGEQNSIETHQVIASTVEKQDSSVDGCPAYFIDTRRKVATRDFEALLAYLYHDSPLEESASFTHLAHVLRAAAPQKCDFPQIFVRALGRFDTLYPDDPISADFVDWAHVQDALALVEELGLTDRLKRLYYALVATSDFDIDEDNNSSNAPFSTAQPVDNDTLEAGSSAAPDAPPAVAQSDPSSPSLSPQHTERCLSLLRHMTSHFTPTIFQPPPTAHMACTDALATAWMPLAVQPALARTGGCGVDRPLETLRALRAADWRAEGVCVACITEKRAEWELEARDIWGRMDGWLGLDAPSI